MSEFKITNTLYYQAKQLRVAKLRLCREVYNGFASLFAKKFQK